MSIKEFYTEEPFDLCGVDIPCYTGESMDAWDNDESTFIDSDGAEGFHYCPVAWVVKLDEGEPLCDIDDLVKEIVTRCINWYDAALEAHWNLDRILHIRREYDIRIGEALNLFKKKKGEDYMGHRSIGTFAVEHMSFSGRLASELMHNSETLSNLPLTKKAYLQGKIKKSALRHLSRVLTPENESEWISSAQNLSINALEKAVRQALDEKTSVLNADTKGERPENGNNPGIGNDSGSGNKTGKGSGPENCCDADDFTQCAPAIPSEESDEMLKGVMMNFKVSCRLAPVWDFALQHFRDKEHYNGPIGDFIEVLCANYIASGRGAGENTQSPVDSSAFPIFHISHMRMEDRDEDSSIDDPPRQVEKHLNIAEEEHYDMPWYIFFPPSFHENPETAEGIAEKLIELASDRQILDVAMGKLLWAIRDWGLHRLLGCGHIEEYGKKKCDLPKPLMYRLIRLADGFRRRPLIRKAFETGLLSREQARLILRIVNEDNERIWIDYAAHAPTVTLKEELERCTRIIEYDCFAPTSYNILPGFRYITDDRFHELSEEMKDIIRTGSWYRRSSPELSWPLENVDEHLPMERDRRLEEPWNHFDDVDDFLAYQAEAADSRNRKNFKCACQADTGTSDQNSENFKCACQAGLGTSDQNSENLKCACQADTGASAQNSENFKCAGQADKQIAYSGKARSNEETLAEARDICSMPHGADPAETFLMEILAEDSGSAVRNSKMSIRFFLPEELYELWNVTAMIYLHRATENATMNVGGMNLRSVQELPPRNPGLAEGFLAALLQDYLFTERLHHKVTSNYAILRRDRFRCQVPGCNCRRNLHVHHIIRRSNGGSDDPVNLIVLCATHHLYILHGLMTLKIEGTSPHNLTFTFGPNSSKGDRPFLVYKNGRKQLKYSRQRYLSGKLKLDGSQMNHPCLA